MVLSLSLAPFLLSMLFVEFKLEHDHSREWLDKYKQVRPFYWWSLVTHDGMALGTTINGPLKIALHPFVIYTNLANQRTEHFTINRLGFRGREILKSQKTRKRIVLIGGSSAFGTGLENDDQTLGSYIENLLDVQVINAAVIGHGSGQELVYLLTELVELHPDLVLTLDGHNDYHRLREVKSLRLLGTNNSFNQIEDQLIQLRSLKAPSFWVRASNLYWVLFPRVSNRIENSKYWRYWQVPIDETNHLEQPDLNASAEVYAKNIIKMHKMATAFQYNFLCVLQPDRDRDDEYRSFRDLAKAYFLREGLKYLDLSEFNEIKAERFMDRIHLDAAGNKVMAEIIGKTIIRENLLSPTARSIAVPFPIIEP